MKRYLNLEITDTYVNFLEKTGSENFVVNYGNFELEEGIVDNGNIKNLDKLASLIKKHLNIHKIKSQLVNLILPEDIINIRRIEVPLDVEDIRTYIQENHLKTLSVIISDPIFDFVVHQIYTTKKIVIFYSLSNKILLKYFDLIEKIGKKLNDYDIFQNINYSAYVLSKKEYDVNNLLIFNLEKDKLVLNIYENDVPIFSVTEEMDLTNKETRSELIEYEVNRIKRYYKFNLSQGNKEIERQVLIDKVSISFDEIEGMKKNIGYIDVLKIQTINDIFSDMITNNQLLTLTMGECNLNGQQK